MMNVHAPSDERGARGRSDNVDAGGSEASEDAMSDKVQSVRVKVGSGWSFVWEDRRGHLV